MVHGDDSGLVLPPRIAPIQVVIVPIAAHKPGVLDKARELAANLGEQFRIKLDESDKMPGWKFAEYEMKGVPLRLEIGPRDLENNQCVAVRRDNGEKSVVSLDHLDQTVAQLLDAVHAGLYTKAEQSLNSRIYDAADWETFTSLIAQKPGFVRAMWCAISPANRNQGRNDRDFALPAFRP